MNENMVMEMYSKDISRIKLPPISDKVRSAMREKREKNTEKPEHHESSPKAHKIIPVKYIFAAMLVLLAVSVPIIIILTDNTSTPFVANENSIVNNTDTVSSADTKPQNTESSESSSAETNENVLEEIKEEKLYGTVSLSQRSENELESLLTAYSKDAQIYEDESYIYSFDKEGNLLELLRMSPLDENARPATEEEIKAKTQAVMEKYYPDWKDGTYDTSINNIEDAYPAWTVYNKKNSGLEIIKLRICYDKGGNLISISLAGAGSDIGSISKADAIQLALTEIRSGKYDVPQFSDEDIEVTVEIKYNGDKPYYSVLIDRIPMEMDILMCVGVKIDPDTGDVLGVDLF